MQRLSRASLARGGRHGLQQFARLAHHPLFEVTDGGADEEIAELDDAPALEEVDGLCWELLEKALEDLLSSR